MAVSNEIPSCLGPSRRGQCWQRCLILNIGYCEWRCGGGRVDACRFGVLTANSEPYRDLWALRSTRLGVDYDCWQVQGGRHVQAMKPECRRYRISLKSE